MQINETLCFGLNFIKKQRKKEFGNIKAKQGRCTFQQDQKLFRG